jgi:lipopolysaccharide transport system ATP-binding protein
MSEAIITVENLGKRYRLGAGRSSERYTALRDVIADKARALIRNPRSAIRNGSEADASEFWALKGVSFEVKQGEVLGIIGRNGAGKSTLLKILSRITEPTEGKARIKGRVASLLEVGTGFHPELTGRENVYLNGAILGMGRTEIKAKFDEIVAFAEIEKFLDTPVKRYSSGMYVRLAFAVAAHLDPEILIVDEVLAVGDAEFQKKCLGKMEAVAKGGRTVLFVSHNMAAVRDLCSIAILLRDGRVASRGAVETLINEYLLSGADRSGFVKFDHLSAGSKPQKRAFFHSASVVNHAGEITSVIDVRHGCSIHLIYEIPKPLTNLEVGIRISTSDGRPVMTSLISEIFRKIHESPQQGMLRATVSVPGKFLMPGSYLITIALLESDQHIIDAHEGILRIDVEDTGTVFTKYKNNRAIGVVMKPLEWTYTVITTNTNLLSV